MSTTNRDLQKPLQLNDNEDICPLPVLLQLLTFDTPVRFRVEVGALCSGKLVEQVFDCCCCCSL